MILNNIAAANRRLFRFRLNKNIEFNNLWHDIILFRMYLNYIILVVWHGFIFNLFRSFILSVFIYNYSKYTYL